MNQQRWRGLKAFFAKLAGKKITPKKTKIKRDPREIYPRTLALRAIRKRYRRSGIPKLSYIVGRRGMADYFRTLRRQFPDVRGKGRRKFDEAMIEKWGQERYDDRISRAMASTNLDRFYSKLERTRNPKLRDKFQRHIRLLRELMSSD